MRNLIEIKGVTRTFGPQEVLRGVDVSLPQRGLIGIVGTSGSGKTTLLNIISGLDVSYQGECRLGGYLLKAMKERDRSLFRLRHVGYLFQNFNLLELETVLTNVLLPIDALKSSSIRLKKRKALDLLSFVGLEGKSRQIVNTLSGGEKQRVSLARALANDPSILLCDEPSGALDEKNAALVFSLLKGVSEKRLVIVVSHDCKLLESYVDAIVLIKDGTARYRQGPKKAPTARAPESLDLPSRKERPRLGTMFLLTHAFHLLKAKKWRSLVSEGAIAAALIGLGLSVYVSSSISTELKGAFGSLIPRDQIVMTPLNPVDNPISSVYSAPEGDVASLCTNYSDDVKDWGTSYLVNFEQFYIDRNELFVPRGHAEIVLPSFSLRSVNDYLWLDDYPSFRYFPEKPKVMEEDQVVLGLPYASMFNLCFGLQILRNYESLGHHIALRGLQAVFRLANYSWGYEDEQLLKVVAVAATPEPTLFHLNHRWSTYLFETKMRFPSSDHLDSSLPWIMNKVHYLEAKSDLTDLLKKLRNDRSRASYVYERPSHGYESSHCPLDEVCPLPRAYVYIADKSSVPYRDILSAQQAFPGIKSRIITTNGSYWSLPSSLMAGFAQKFFISAFEDSLDEVIDAVSDVDREESSLEIALPEGVVDGHYLRSASGGFRLSSDLSVISGGRAPVGIEEVALSSSLFGKLGHPEGIVAAGQIEEKEIGDRIVRSFRKSPLKVVGVVESKKDVVYVPADWTIDFFRDALGMSSFLLEPTGAVFVLGDERKVSEAVAFLGRNFPSYRFVDPGESIAKSIASTTAYIGVVLTAFSAVSLFISSLLFIIVTMISVAENKGEAYLFHVLGLSRRDIARSYVWQTFLYAFLSLGLSGFALFFSQVLIHGYLSVSFSSSSPFAFSFIPLAAMGGFALLSFLLVSFFLFLHFERTKLST